MNLRVLIVDDHPLMRAGIRTLLEKTVRNVDILEAVDGLDAFELATQSHPDVVLMDISMPGLNGIDAARRLTSAVPGCKVIMLSMHQDEQRVVESIRGGRSTPSSPLRQCATARLGDGAARPRAAFVSV